MKLIVKIMIALALLGGVLLGIGLRSGGELYTGLQDGELRTASGRYDSAASHGSGEVLDYSKLDTLYLTVSGGSCDIDAGDRLTYSESVDIVLDGDTLTLSAARDAEITLPANQFSSVYVEVSGGQLDLEGLDTFVISQNEDWTTFSLQISGGEVDIDTLRTGNLIIDSSMGSIEIDQLTATQSDLQVSAGELSVDEYHGLILNASCAGGHIEIGMAEGADYYNCTSDVTAGSCTWNGGALKDAGFGGEGARGTLDLTVTAGAIELHRAEKD